MQGFDRPDSRADAELFSLPEAARQLNVVCLMGLLTKPVSAQPLPPGWSHRVLEVARETIYGDDDPGVFEVLLMLSPGLTTGVSSKMDVGDPVTVVGRLHVDTHFSQERPISHYAVIVQRIEAIPVGHLAPLSA